MLLKAFTAGAALELVQVHLGGNRVSGSGMAVSVWLKQLRPDLDVDWEERLPDCDARPLCAVGAVYTDSPAHAAGLKAGDKLLAIGPVRRADFASVAETIVPLVRSRVGMPLEVVVARAQGGARADGLSAPRHEGLTLTPAEWSGKGLLGCALK